jgi:hypothetical protein
MQPHKIVSREEWIEARKAHMAREKELTRARDALSEERRALPWVKVDKAYLFDAPSGKVTSRRTGTPPARAARSGPTALSAWSRISPRATPP